MRHRAKIKGQSNYDSMGKKYPMTLVALGYHRQKIGEKEKKG
jgi:hypothetical protein